jgi:hypothetical protein
MQLTEIRDYVLGKLHITEAEFVENHTSLLYVANMVLKDIAGAISWKNLGYFGDFTDLDVTGSVRIYPIPAEVQNKIRAIEVNVGGSWKKLTIKDINDIPNFEFNETWITENFNNEEPVGFIYGGKLHILSGQVIAVAPGIRYWFITVPDKITSMDSTLELHEITTVRSMTGTTMAIGLPRQFEKLFATGIIIDYKEANELPLVGREQLYDQDLKTKLNELSPLSTDEEVTASIPSDDGSNY